MILKIYKGDTVISYWFFTMKTAILQSYKRYLVTFYLYPIAIYSLVTFVFPGRLAGIRALKWYSESYRCFQSATKKNG